MLVSAQRLSNGLFGALSGPTEPDPGGPNQSIGKKDTDTEENATPLRLVAV
ncbi:hypothetical protein SAMN02745136_04626 [Anaerocolumna jejuensis DSM 15929]|uniref:Uncharacterized protein n=1 Tax=Anaerocolumna jejuensis DSM 15929 TaxID=1121322 RepID=A0A1M6ZM09_9FIRM|nr:hypothetical protein [Anaerocolumna jejuensis]SHL31502.1 hypothetical protein SAMN02745136_04626 [Anaerocolumna jejuensis DSM 15929]